MKKITVLALPLLLAPLAASARLAEPQRVEGHYRVEWEEQSFQPCGSRDKWWVSDPGPLLRRYRDVVKEGDYGTVYAVVRAEVSEPGMYGHLGMYRRAIAVREVLEARAPADGDCQTRTVEAE